MRCFILPLVVITVFAGCAPHTERAVRQTERISELAQSSAARFQRIEDEATAVSPVLEIIVDEAWQGRSEQREIQQAAAAARRQIVHTQDIRSPWFGILTLWAIVFLAAFIVIALIYLGVVPLARRFLSGRASENCKS